MRKQGPERPPRSVLASCVWVLGWVRAGLYSALKGASAQKVGCLWSGQGMLILDPIFPDAYFKGLWTLGNLIARLG